MRKGTYTSLLTGLVCLLISLPTSAEEKTAIAKLQSSRTESILSTLKFMTQIYSLEEKAQTRLLHSRLSNTTQVFRNDKELDNSKNILGVSITTSENSWSLSVDSEIEIKDENKRSSLVYFKLIIDIEPNSLIQKWMKIRDEYLEYSNEKILDEYLDFLEISGKIESFTWEKKPSGYLEGTPLYDPPTYVLTLNLDEYSTQELKIVGPAYRNADDDELHKTYTGSLSAQTDFLREKISKWVKFLMGKNPKPKLIFDAE